MTMWDFMDQHPVHFWIFFIITLGFIETQVSKIKTR
jgi:hypothetical protein